MLTALLLLATASAALPLSEFAAPGFNDTDRWPVPEAVKPYVARPQIEARVPPAMQWTGDETPREIYEKTMFRADICIFGTARRFALTTKEPAATIADASIANCTSWHGVLASAAFLLLKDIKLGDQITTRYFDTRRGKATAFVMEIRTRPSPKQKR